MSDITVMERLIAAGFEEKKAKAVTLELSYRDTRLATRDDIKEVKDDIADVKDDIADVKKDIRRLYGVLVAILCTIVGGIAAAGAAYLFEKLLS